MYFEWSFKVNYCLDSFALNVCVWWYVYDGVGAFSYHPEKTFLYPDILSCDYQDDEKTSTSQ